MSASRSLPAAWIVVANSTCCSERLPSGLSASSRDRISSEFSGVRSSWLMLARNSDLYFEDSASWVAFSSRPGARALDLDVLGLQLARQRLRLREQLLRAHVRPDRVQHDADRLGDLLQERPVDLADLLQRRQLDDAEDLLLEDDRQDDDVARRRAPLALHWLHHLRRGLRRRLHAPARRPLLLAHTAQHRRYRRHVRVGLAWPRRLGGAYRHYG